MATGTVKWFNDDKGFGFIEQEVGEDIFVHYSEIEMEGFKTLDEDQEVEFELEETEKGLAATGVQPVDDSGQASEDSASDVDVEEEEEESEESGQSIL
jgi:CspA family cold shock protein